MVGLVDTHTHLFVEEFDEDRELALIRARQAGVTRFFMPNIDDGSVERMLGLCEAHDDCFPMIGLHPTSVDADWKGRLERVERWFRSDKVFYGIGEVGMDLYWDSTYRKEQMEVFGKQVGWALESGLPLVIHCRSAYPELLDVLKHYRQEPLTGIFHSFGGTEDDANRLLESGISGVYVRHQRSGDVQEKHLAGSFEKGGSVRTRCLGNRFPLFGSGALQREEK